MAIFACIIPSVIVASQTESEGTAVLLVGLATACHQGWSANMFTLASDMFPRRAVGTVVGFGGFAGGIGGGPIPGIARPRVEAETPFFPPPVFRARPDLLFAPPPAPTPPPRPP